MKRYSRYYSINFDYIHELPENWQLLPNIAIFNERKQKGFQNEELLSVSIPRGVVRQSDMGKKDISSPDKSNYKLVMPGDLAYGMEFRKGAVGYSNFKGIVSPVYTILKSKIKINPKFFHYQYRLDFYKNYVWRYVYGIGEHFLPLRFKDFKRMYSIVPPLDAQNAIVAYLDRKTKRANDFIAKQTRLIEVLKEQKQAMLTKVVTKGLNPDVLVKDSGIEWLEKIPTHWGKSKLKYIWLFDISREIYLVAPSYVAAWFGSIASLPPRRAALPSRRLDTTSSYHGKYQRTIYFLYYLWTVTS